MFNRPNNLYPACADWVKFSYSQNSLQGVHVGLPLLAHWQGWSLHSRTKLNEQIFYYVQYARSLTLCIRPDLTWAIFWRDSLLDFSITGLHYQFFNFIIPDLTCQPLQIIPKTTLKCLSFSIICWKILSFLQLHCAELSWPLYLHSNWKVVKHKCFCFPGTRTHSCLVSIAWRPKKQQYERKNKMNVDRGMSTNTGQQLTQRINYNKGERNQKTSCVGASLGLNPVWVLPALPAFCSIKAQRRAEWPAEPF